MSRAPARPHAAPKAAPTPAAPAPTAQAAPAATGPTPAPQAAHAAPPAPAIAILVALDPEEVNLERQLLRRAGLTAVPVPAPSARSALPAARLAVVNGNFGTPDELEALSAVRASLPETVPVLFIGATTEAATVAAIIAHGAADYLARPLAPEPFRQKTLALLGGAAAPREREDFRRRLGATAVTPIKVRGCAAKRLALETPFPVPPGSRLAFTAPGLSKLAGLGPGQRYTCRVTACHPQGKTFLLTGDLLGSPLELPANRG